MKFAVVIPIKGAMTFMCVRGGTHKQIDFWKLILKYW